MENSKFGLVETAGPSLWVALRMRKLMTLDWGAAGLPWARYDAHLALTEALRLARR